MLLEVFNQYLPQHQLLANLSILGILSLASLFSYLIAEKIIISALATMFRKTSTTLDDILVQQNVFNRLAYVIPALIFYSFSNLIPEISIIIQRISLSLMALSAILVINAFMNALNAIYSKTKYSERMHIKSYIQIIKLILNILGIVIIIAILINKDLSWFLGGLSAMSVVLMLIFKETILSFVASIQINSNNLFKIGDWIEAPQFGADGDVIDIALHAVKIQNWDKTISIIPTHKLIDSSFKNWKGMSESGGRRIKRSIYIDMNTIKLCNNGMLNKFKKFTLLNNYIDNKIIEVNEFNTNNNIDTTEPINGRRLTNIGTFRAYVKAYLKSNSNIHPDMTFLVRQLEPTSMGLPIQIYVFSSNTNWIEYERIQSDIFDHLLAILPEFGLRIFQNPTGRDFEKLKD